MSTQKGILTVSLDFELHWGLRDIFPLDLCRDRLVGAREVIPKILQLFETFDVHATWATVGFLFYANKSALLQGQPNEKPNYKNKKLNPYDVLDELGESESDDPYHYAPSVIRNIAETAGQEIASHTFSHYYCLEEGQTDEAFRSDLEAAKKAAESLGIELRSLVFPRNQCNEQYLAICRDLGFISYRGNPSSWLYVATDSEHQTLIRRAMRMVDAYLNLSGNNSHDVVNLTRNLPIEIPASRFLRPYIKALSYLEPLRLSRIKKDMTSAAVHGRLYHLWWHPHNFGCDIEENMAFLHDILRHYQSLKNEYGMYSLNMTELADSLLDKT